MDFPFLELFGGILFVFKMNLLDANSGDPDQMLYTTFYWTWANSAELGLNGLMYCKTCVKWPLKNTQNKDLYDKW